MPTSPIDSLELREAILSTLARTGEPMLVRDIATFLKRRGWEGNMVARVASHITSLRAQGKTASINIPTGHAFIKHGRTFEIRARAWFLATTPINKIRSASIADIGRRPRFMKPPEPHVRTDDMRQMLVDLGWVQ